MFYLCFHLSTLFVNGLAYYMLLAVGFSGVLAVYALNLVECQLASCISQAAALPVPQIATHCQKENTNF